MIIEAVVPQRLTCAILEDDAINRYTLEHYIQLTDSVELVASLEGSMEGLDFFSNGRCVDVLFLDIEMPDLNGLDMLRLLPEPPLVVLTTAHDNFTWDAFELRVTDYLVKPFNRDRFDQAIKRVRERLQIGKTAGTTSKPALGGPESTSINLSMQ